ERGTAASLACASGSDVGPQTPITGVRIVFKSLLHLVSHRRALTTIRRRRPTRLALEGLEERCAPAVLTVNSVADNTTRDNFLTLREAIQVVDGTLGRSLSPQEQGQIA